MAWIDRIWPWGERKRIEDSGALARFLMNGGASKAGAAVNLHTAMQVSTVLACGRVISEGCAQTPFRMIRKDGDARMPVSNHPVAELFWLEPNAWMTPFELIEQMALHLALAGNAYCIKTFNNLGEVLELLPLEPGWVEPKRLENWEVEYKVRFPGGGAAETIPASNIWHVRGPSWASYYGLDPVKLAREAIGLAIATEEFGAGLFKNGGRPGGYLVTEDALTPEKYEDLRARWEKAQEGSRNAFRTAILSGGLKYVSVAMNADEAQFLETRKLQVEEICRHMRVLPIMVGHSGDKNATFASAEQMFNVHDKAHLGPWFSRIEQSATKNLLSRAERKSGLSMKFRANALMRASASDRAEYYSRALGSGGAPGWMAQDEVRALEDMNPMGGAAAALPIPTNIAPVGEGD